MKEAYVSFEIAKLLKEKGFDEKTTHWYNARESLIADYPVSYEIFYNPEEVWLAPTHQMACAWLREIYDLHIIAYPFKSGNDASTKHYCCQVFKTFNLLGYEKYTNETLTSYEEAVESAIKYCLENLI